MKKWLIAGATALIAIVAITGVAVALMDSGGGDDGSRVSRPADENDGSDTDTAPICIEGAIDCDDTIEEPVTDDPDAPVSSGPITIIDDQDPNLCNLVHNITACEEAVIALVTEDLAQRLGSPGDITVESVEFVQWPDSCLGISKTDVACAEVITPGFKVVLEVGDQTFEYHTDGGSRAVLVE